MSKRFRAGLIGCAFGLAYGLWSGSVTGGGHGNFVWLLIFVFVQFFGIYFPVMAVLAVDLTSRTKRIVFAALLLYYLIASLVLIVGWITEVADGTKTDFVRVVEHSGIGSVVLCISIHFLPTLVLATFLFKRISTAEELTESEPIGLGLS